MLRERSRPVRGSVARVSDDLALEPELGLCFGAVALGASVPTVTSRLTLRPPGSCADPGRPLCRGR